VATYKYRTTELPVNFTEQEVTISNGERDLIDSFAINSSYNQNKHRLDLYIYSLEDILLETYTDYTDYTQQVSSAGAGKDGASNLTLDPQQDAIKLGYESGDVKLLYTFNNNLYTEGKFGGTLFIESISPDRTEFRALSIEVPTDKLTEYTNKLKSKLNDPSYFSEFNINFGTGTIAIGLNIELEQTTKGLGVVFKTYDPLPGNILINSKLTVEEKVADSKLFEVTTEYIEDIIKVPYLKGPNFDVELTQVNKNPTQYLNYNELFSYPITGSNYELFALFKEKGAEITIRHDDFSEFIHFSSAEERLRNFHYKLSLIEAYESQLVNTIPSSSYNAIGVSGSRDTYQGLIRGIVENFDHYDRFLYFSSGSNSWPKTNSTKPYQNVSPTSTIGEAWLTKQLTSASLYDNTNYDSLVNTIPTYIREDSNNEPYLMFTHMIGQHFDNLWVYFNAVSDKYDADNRLNFGISKDLVREAIESFGIKLYNSNQNLDNLFSMYVGETPSTGSELIVSMSIATAPEFNSGSTSLQHLQPVAKNDYEKEIYKRIYHNLPHLVKTKGTERGLRALINCFGIPESILSVKGYGGVKIDTDRFFGPEYYTTGSSLDKIRIDNTGSITTGNTLSRYTSINKKEKKYTDDSHLVQIGFNISRGTNEFIDIKTSGSFDIDQYIGDPRSGGEEKYVELTKLGRSITNMSYTWEDIIRKWEDADWNWDDHLEYARDPKAFIRLLNFFDSSLFRIIKDFLPARTKVDTGVIIESHKLARSKIKQVEVSYEDVVVTGSLSIGSTTGSSGGAYDLSGSYNYTTNYSQSIVSPLGEIPRNVTDESPMFNGELSGSYIEVTKGEVGSKNPFIGSLQPLITFNLTLFNLSLPLPPACILILESTYVGEYFEIYSTGSEPGPIAITYPSVANILAGGSTNYTANFDNYEFFTLEAQPAGYPASEFEGWYKAFPTGSGNLITTNPVLSIYYEDETTYGNKFYASFK
jgi:hypothetical protein